MDAARAKRISNQSSTPRNDKVESHLIKISAKIGRASRQGETHIFHKFHRWFGGVSQREKELVIDQLIEREFCIGTVRQETDAYRISW